MHQSKWRISLWGLLLGCTITKAATATSVQDAAIPADVDAKAAEQMPAKIPNAPPQSGKVGSRLWTIEALVGVREIKGLARSEKSEEAAFIVEEDRMDTGDPRYGLYVVALDGRSSAHKIAGSDFIADLQLRSGTSRWTVRADFGRGVQVYDIDDAGRISPVLVNDRLTRVGGIDGLVISAHGGPHPTGILAYGWAPDGSALWYTKLRLRDADAARRLDDRGIVYDDDTMYSMATHKDEVTMLGTELRMLDVGTQRDTLVAYAPRAGLGMDAFTPAQTQWSADSKRLQYVFDTSVNGERKVSRWSVDRDGASQRLDDPGKSWLELYASMPTPDGNGYLTVRSKDEHSHLVAVGKDGSETRDFGEVPYRGVGGYSGTGAWSADGRSAVMDVHLADREGLAHFSDTGGVRADDPLLKIADNLDSCAFDAMLHDAVCVRQAIDKPQTLVRVDLRSARMTTLARPNAALDGIAPLRSERMEWTNRFGSVSDGYITYPRGFRQGQRYPVIVVTHGGDARNRFAYYGFQWEMPVQVLAESGYLVLSVNDPRVDARTRAAQNAFINGDESVDVSQWQFYKNINPLAGLEAAVQSVVERGIADPQRVAISGYSRGCELVELALSQSKVFKVGAEGDAGGFNPGIYWAAGTKDYRTLIRSAFGGSPVDPKAFDNYLRYAPTYRASHFAGPLLQQFTAMTATFGLELHTYLQDAGVPSELVYFPGETHIFWQPRHRAAAMHRNLDWLDYWLRGRRDPDPEKLSQYARWDTMSRTWAQHKTDSVGETN